MLKKVVLALVAALVLFVVAVSMRPSELRVARTGTVGAPPEVVFPLIADFHHWPSWSPWQELDPAQVTTVTGEGVGSKYAWHGNRKVGRGEMTITATEPPRRLDLLLVFEEPMASESDVTFELQPAPEGTVVTWTMVGQNDFFGKAFGLFFDMDAMLGADFEKGLKKLDVAAREAVATAQAEAAAAPAEAAPPADDAAPAAP